MPIPRRIIQTHRHENILRAERQTWRDHHPDYDHCFFDDAQCREFLATRLPQLLATYDALPLAVQKADLFRYAAVHELGGLYADADTLCCAPLHDYVDLDKDHLVACVEMLPAELGPQLGAALRYYCLPYQLLQWTFCAPPRHPVLAVLLDRIRYLVGTQSPAALALLSREMRFTLELTGPIAFTQVVNDFLSGTRTGAVSVLQRPAWGTTPDQWDDPRMAGLVKVKHLFGFSWRDRIDHPPTLRAGGGPRHGGAAGA